MVQPLLLLTLSKLMANVIFHNAAPEVALIRRIIVLMLYHLLHKLHSQVISFVALALRLHQHLFSA